MATTPGKGFISQLPVATSLYATDRVIIDQLGPAGLGPPITKQASLALAYPLPAFVINRQVVTNYVAQLTDTPPQANTLIEMNNAAANTVTISKFATTPWANGSCILLYQKGAGTSSFIQDTGVTFLTASSFVCRARYSIICALCVAQDTWLIGGDPL